MAITKGLLPVGALGSVYGGLAGLATRDWPSSKHIQKMMAERSHAFDELQRNHPMAIEIYGSSYEKVIWNEQSFREELQTETNEWLKDIK